MRKRNNTTTKVYSSYFGSSFDQYSYTDKNKINPILIISSGDYKHKTIGLRLIKVRTVRPTVFIVGLVITLICILIEVLTYN